MGFLKKLFGRDDDSEEGFDAPITLDVERRKVQLVRLEQGLDALATAMRAEQSMDNPGWRARVNEYSRLAGVAMTQRKAPLARDSLLDLVFEVRPVFSGAIPAGLERLGPLQDEVMAAADDLQQLLPGERGITERDQSRCVVSTRAAAQYDQVARGNWGDATDASGDIGCTVHEALLKETQ